MDGSCTDPSAKTQSNKSVSDINKCHTKHASILTLHHTSNSFRVRRQGTVFVSVSELFAYVGKIEYDIQHSENLT
jgi:hypothetical protein